MKTQFAREISRLERLNSSLSAAIEAKDHRWTKRLLRSINKLLDDMWVESFAVQRRPTAEQLFLRSVADGMNMVRSYSEKWWDK